jgi:hypothetical protein
MAGQYAKSGGSGKRAIPGHPSTVMLEDGKTIYCVYPRGHGKGALILKRSDDQGWNWSERLKVPESWATSLETPHIYRVIDPAGKKRLIVWSALYPARYAISEDDGATWSELKAAGEWGGIVAMASQIPMKEPGHYMAFSTMMAVSLPLRTRCSVRPFSLSTPWKR